MQKKSKVSSWPSWEEVSEEKDMLNKGKEIEDEFIDEKPRFKPSAKQNAAGGVMVVYDAPTGESSVIEINTTQTAGGQINVQVATESGALAKIGFAMAILGAPVSLVGVCMHVFSLNIDGWYEVVGGVRHMVLWVYNTSILLAGIGAIMLMLGMVFSLYGRYIHGKATRV
jgi:hypothetical protein